MSIKGIYGKKYIDLSNHVDLSDYDKLHPNICRGIATSKSLAYSGMNDMPETRVNSKIYNNDFTPLYETNKILKNLSEDNPHRIATKDLNDNQLSVYLKFAFGGYDLYSFYVLIDFEFGWRKDSNIKNISQLGTHFPNLIDWTYGLIDKKIFSHIGRACLFIQEAGGVSIEHTDEYLDNDGIGIQTEFIHIQQTLDRKFYVRDNETNEKTYLTSRVSYFNDQDWHGGEPVMKPTYSYRIDGIFTEEFRNKICR